MEVTTVLSVSKLHEMLTYYPDNGALVWKERPRSHFKSDRDHLWWNKTFSGSLALNYQKHNGYLEGTIDGKPYLAHRVIWYMVHGEWPDQIDHINGNKNQNHLSNLRNVDQRTNGRNQKRSSLNTSGVTGVYWHKTSSKWRSVIKVDGHRKYLGHFDDFNEAVKARKEAEVKYGFHENHGRG